MTCPTPRRRALSALLALVLALTCAPLCAARSRAVDVSGEGDATAADADTSEDTGEAASSASSADAAAADAAAALSASSRTFSYTEWDADLYPDYWREVGAAVVDVEVEPGTVVYSDLDELGRTGRVVANVTWEMARAGSESERPNMSSIHPSGWGHNAEVDIPMPDGSTYHGALFNRSHLLAKSLGGAAVIENLVCATRTQNVGDNESPDGGMAYPEGLAREWLWDHQDGSVYYSATPVYEGDELLCRSVIVDLRSSDGSLDLEVEVYNAALGFVIDYVDGSWDYA